MGTWPVYLVHIGACFQQFEHLLNAASHIQAKSMELNVQPVASYPLQQLCVTILTTHVNHMIGTRELLTWFGFQSLHSVWVTIQHDFPKQLYFIQTCLINFWLLIWVFSTFLSKVVGKIFHMKFSYVHKWLAFA